MENSMKCIINRYPAQWAIKKKTATGSAGNDGKLGGGPSEDRGLLAKEGFVLRSRLTILKKSEGDVG